MNQLEELTGTKKKILEVAIELFSRKGYSDVSVRELTREVGIKEGNARTLAIQYQYPIFTMMTEYLLLKYDHKENDSVEQKMKEHLNFYMLVLNSDIELP